MLFFILYFNKCPFFFLLAKLLSILVFTLSISDISIPFYTKYKYMLSNNGTNICIILLKNLKNKHYILKEILCGCVIFESSLANVPCYSWYMIWVDYINFFIWHKFICKLYQFFFHTYMLVLYQFYVSYTNFILNISIIVFISYTKIIYIYIYIFFFSKQGYIPNIFFKEIGKSI